MIHRCQRTIVKFFIVNVKTICLKDLVGQTFYPFWAGKHIPPNFGTFESMIFRISPGWEMLVSWRAPPPTKAKKKTRSTRLLRICWVWVWLQVDMPLGRCMELTGFCIGFWLLKLGKIGQSSMISTILRTSDISLGNPKIGKSQNTLVFLVR